MSDSSGHPNKIHRWSSPAIVSLFLTPLKKPSSSSSFSCSHEHVNGWICLENITFLCHVFFVRSLFGCAQPICNGLVCQAIALLLAAFCPSFPSEFSTCIELRHCGFSNVCFPNLLLTCATQHSYSDWTCLLQFPLLCVLSFWFWFWFWLAPALQAPSQLVVWHLLHENTWRFCKSLQRLHHADQPFCWLVRFIVSRRRQPYDFVLAYRESLELRGVWLSVMEILCLHDPNSLSRDSNAAEAYTAYITLFGNRWALPS